MSCFVADENSPDELHSRCCSQTIGDDLSPSDSLPALLYNDKFYNPCKNRFLRELKLEETSFRARDFSSQEIENGNVSGPSDSNVLSSLDKVEKWTIMANNAFHSCDECEFVAKSAAGLKRHRSVHNIKSIYCYLCEKTFKKRSKLRQHIKKQHKVASTCQICGRVLASRSSLMVHQRIHSGLKPFTCTLCNYAARQAAALNFHMQNCHFT